MEKLSTGEKKTDNSYLLLDFETLTVLKTLLFTDCVRSAVYGREKIAYRRLKVESIVFDT